MSVWKNKKAQKEGRFFRGTRIAYWIYEYFRVNGANYSGRELCRPPTSDVMNILEEIVRNYHIVLY